MNILSFTSNGWFWWSWDGRLHFSWDCLGLGGDGDVDVDGDGYVIWGWWWMLAICLKSLDPSLSICRSCLVNYHPRTEAAGGELATTTTSPRSRFTFWEMVTRIWKAATSYQRRRSDTFTWEMVTTISWEGGRGGAVWEMVTSPTKCCQDVAAICWVGFVNKLLMKWTSQTCDQNNVTLISQN